jgi:hypothetical protein
MVRLKNNSTKGKYFHTGLYLWLFFLREESDVLVKMTISVGSKERVWYNPGQVSST